jgi:hypothetical protein
LLAQVDASASATLDVSASFKSSCQVAVVAFGGNPVLLALSAFQANAKAWSETLYKNAAPINTTYTKISNLITDSEKRLLLDEAISERLSSCPGSNRTDICISLPGLDLTGIDELLQPSSSSGAYQNAQTPTQFAFNNASAGAGYDLHRGKRTRQLYLMSYTQNHTFQNPNDAGGTIQRIPDHLLVVSSPSMCVRSQEHFIMNASMVVQMWADATADMEAVIIPSMILWPLSFFHAFADVVGEVAADLKDFALGSAMFEIRLEFFRVSVEETSGLSIHPAFAADIKQLPLNSSSAQYDEFFKGWGSHSVHTMSLGGYCRFEIQFNQSLLANMDVNVVWSQSIGLNLLLLDAIGALTKHSKLKPNKPVASLGPATELTAAVGVADAVILVKSAADFPVSGVVQIDSELIRYASKTATSLTGLWRGDLITEASSHSPSAKVQFTLDQQFRADLELKFHCEGGDPTIIGSIHALTPNGYGKWAQTVAEQPLPVERSIKLRPIYDLVDDSAKKSAMQGALIRFMNESSEEKLTSRRRVRGHAAAHSSFDAPSSRPMSPPFITQAVPGACTGAGSTGVGCGYDITQVDPYGIGINPKKPVVKVKPFCLRHSIELT